MTSPLPAPFLAAPRRRLLAALLGLSTWLAAGCAAPPAADPGAEVIFRFTTVGDSRADARQPGLSGQDRRWVQATRVLARITHEMEQAQPQALMFNGDMVMGYTQDATQLEREYAYWRGMVAGMMERGTYVLPVPGNHEVQMPTRQPGGGSVKLAQPWLEEVWRANMGDLVLDTARWPAGLPISAWDLNNTPAVGTDGITTPQQQLSYAFDVGPVHIAVINTDPVGQDGSVPVQWLRRDFAAAKARGAKNFFVFGHKMAYAYDFSDKPVEKEDGLSERPAVRDAFWRLMEDYGATYFCGHQHIFHASQPLKAQGGRAWQVIVGSGGSPFAAKPGQSRNPLDRYYAWADVSVLRNGTARVVVRGFDEHFGPTRVLQAWDIR